MLQALAVLAVLTQQFVLKDTNAVVHRQDEWARAKAVVVFFTTTDCPLSNNYVPEMNRIQKAYAARGAAFYAVQTDTTISEAVVRKQPGISAFLSWFCSIRISFSSVWSAQR